MFGKANSIVWMIPNERAGAWMPLGRVCSIGFGKQGSAGTRARGVRKGILPLAIPAAEGRKKPSRSDGKGRSPASAATQWQLNQPSGLTSRKGWPRPRRPEDGLLVNRELVTQSDNLGFHLGFDRVRRTVFQCVQHVTDPASQLGGFGFFEATAGDGRGTDTHTRGDERRTRVVRNGGFVDGDVGAAQSGGSVFTGVLLADQVDQEQVVVSTAGYRVDAALNEGFGHGLSVLNHLRLV